MTKGLISCIPVFTLIVLVLITHRMAESMFVASMLSAVLAYKSEFFSGYVELIYKALSNSSYQLLLMVSCLFGGMIMLLEKSGSMYGFQKCLSRFCTTPVRTMIFTWLLGGIIFIDDYLNALTVSVSMRGLSDYHKIPREHLAYTINCMGACVCVLIPVSSWSAFAIGSLADYGLGASDYYKAIPYMFYPLCCIVISLLLACRKIPLIGSMKRAYQRVEESGRVLSEKNVKQKMEEPSENLLDKSSVWNFLIPMICLFVGTVGFENNIILGIMFALFSLFFLLCVKGKMKTSEFTDLFIDGIKEMIPLLVTITLGCVMQSGMEKMGFNDYISSVCSKTLNVKILPLVAFLMVAIAAFFAASFWILIVLTFPIFIPIVQSMGGNPLLIIAAVMSGVALGSQACIFSDAVFMVASGTGVSNEDQFRAIFPYVAIGATIAGIMFLIAGLLQ